MTVGLLAPPLVDLDWIATALGPYFQAYRGYTRPRRLPAVPFTLAFEHGVPTGYDRATVEAQHIHHNLLKLGWYSPGGEWAEGHDIVVTSVDTTGAEAQILRQSITALGLTIPDPKVTWWVCDQVPPLSCPIEQLDPTSSGLNRQPIAREYAGRDGYVSIVPAERPGRSLGSRADFFGEVGPDELRYLRRAAQAGLQFVMLRPLGDRIVGTPWVSGFDDVMDARQSVNIGMIESKGAEAVAEYNLPALSALNGSSQYLTSPDGNHLDFGTGDFSVIIAGIFPATSGAVHIAKGNGGAGTSWALRNTSGTQVSFSINGTNVITVSSSVLTDGAVHVLEARATQGAQELLLDGVQIGVGTASYTTVSNATALVAGANNAGASGFSALGLQSYAAYPVKNSDARSLAAAHYLLGYPSSGRMPAGAVVFVDHRDDRCWNGIAATRSDLSEWGNTVTAVASPATRGIPWPLGRYEIV